jgi:5'-nucleotidase
VRILLTNDDGIHAPGFAVLETIAARLSDDIWAVAPSEEQSGAGHSLTLSRPIRLRRHGEKRFSVSGTPTDAVMMALAHIMKDSPPDLILSGINRGANLAEDVTYSGTVSAAMEGALAGVRSIALSQAYSREGMGDTVPFAAAEAWADRVLRPLTPPSLQARWSTSISRRFRPMRLKASGSAGRAFATMAGFASSSGPIRAAIDTIGSAWLPRSKHRVI